MRTCIVYACPPCGVLVRARSVRDKAVSSRLSANLWCLIDCFPKGCLFHQRGLNKSRRHKNVSSKIFVTPDLKLKLKKRTGGERQIQNSEGFLCLNFPF
jgi:hypothetical protein